MRVLVTGGAAFIGSHTVLELLGQAKEVLIADNYCNSSPMVIERIRQLSNGSVTAKDQVWLGWPNLPISKLRSATNDALVILVVALLLLSSTH